MTFSNPNGVSVHTAEFRGKELCEIAGKEWKLKTKSAWNSASYICVRAE